MFWRLREFFKDKTDDDMVVIRGFIEPIVEAAISKRSEDVSNEGKEVTLLDHLVNVTDSESLCFTLDIYSPVSPSDKKIIVDEVLNM